MSDRDWGMGIIKRLSFNFIEFNNKELAGRESGVWPTFKRKYLRGEKFKKCGGKFKKKII